MIYDVFRQPHQAAVMVFFGLCAGLSYELIRLFRPDSGGALWDLLALMPIQVCLIAGLLLAGHGEMRLYAVLLFFGAMGLVRWAFRPLFTEILQKIRKKQFPSR
ncbi:MAG: hypothetical protein IJA71_11530 [Clostridia bacterium]|nr:hypothetical protein [Clostridia bacterium]